MKDHLLKFAAAAIALALFSAPVPLLAGGGTDIETEEVDEDLRPDEVEDDGAEEPADDGDDSGY